MSNVWSFGVVLWEILELGRQPYPALTDSQVLEKVISSRTYVLDQPVNPAFSEKFLQDFYRNFLLPCLNYDPETRPRIADILGSLSRPPPTAKVPETQDDLQGPDASFSN